ncbi:hypothetical protein Q8F55_003395 [Vanrija albida]|uniref:Uncharacterized protein n=1 Tax=Vanrija albida TaxID=181172 RepID=A0ABR3Q4E9_9TREE
MPPVFAHSHLPAPSSGTGMDPAATNGARWPGGIRISPWASFTHALMARLGRELLGGFNITDAELGKTLTEADRRELEEMDKGMRSCLSWEAATKVNFAINKGYTVYLWGVDDSNRLRTPATRRVAIHRTEFRWWYHYHAHIVKISQT